MQESKKLDRMRKNRDVQLIVNGIAGE